MSWWAIDVLSYCLGRVGQLATPLIPFDGSAVTKWIRQTELVWSPAQPESIATIDWLALNSYATEEAMLDYLLRTASSQSLVRDGAGVRLRDGAAGMVARRRLPISSLMIHARHIEFESTPSQANVDLIVSRGCSDTHIHQGASLPFEVICHWIASGMDDLGRLREVTELGKWRSGDGATFTPEPIIALLRACLHGSRTPDLSDVTSAAINLDVAAWQRVGECVAEQRYDPQYRTLEQITSFKQYLYDADPARFWTVVRCEATLLDALLQRAVGLDEFVSRFDQLRRARKIGRGLRKPLLFAEAIRAGRLACSTLAALELRLGEPALTGSGVVDERELLHDLQDAASGLRVSLGDPQSSVIRATFPVSLIRTDPRASNHWRYNLQDGCRIVEALISIMTSRPQSRELIDGLDVCGRETDAPAWVFLPLFERMRTWANSLGVHVDLRCHAGEWPSTPIAGLRAIDDVVSMSGPGFRYVRVGHGLSLVQPEWDRLGSSSCVDVLDDLVWSLTQLRDQPDWSGHRHALQMLVEEILTLGHLGIPVPVEKAISSIEEAQVSRRSLATWVRIGVLSVDPSGTVRFVDGEPSPVRLSDRVLCWQLDSRSVVYDSRVEEVLPADRLKALRGLFGDVYEPLSRLVLGRVRLAGAIVEVCPTSNVLIAGIRGFHLHPARRLGEAGVNLTISTDDPSLFHTSVTEEIRHAARFLDEAALSAAVTLGNVVARTERTRLEIEDAIASLLAGSEEFQMSSRT